MSWRRLQNILKTSLRCLEDVFARRREDTLKASLRRLGKTSGRCLEDVLKMSWRCFWKTSWKRLEDIFWRWMIKANIFVLMKTSWRRLLKTKTKDVFNTSSRRLHQDECLLGCCKWTRLGDYSFNTYLIFFEKLTFLTSWDAHVCMRAGGKKY